MFIHMIILIAAGIYFVQQNDTLNKVIGYTLLGAGVNMFILSCNVPKSPMPQSLILTAIVISIGVTIIMSRRK